MKILIAYFSHKGENYFGGRIVRIEKGNTAVVADKLRALTGADDLLHPAKKQRKARYVTGRTAADCANTVSRM